MPFIGGGNISAPGTPYDGLPIQPTLIALSRAAQGGNQQAIDGLKTLGGLPQFQGFGWQGLLAFGLSVAGGYGAGAALGGGAGTALGTTSAGQLTAGTVVPGTLPAVGAGSGGLGAGIGLGAGAATIAGKAANNPQEIPTIGGGGNVGSSTGTLSDINKVLSNPLLQGSLGFLGGYLNNTQGARTQVQAPVIAPEFQQLAAMLRQHALARLSQGTDTAGLTANAISGINQAYRGISQANNNNLTARGLARSPIAAVVDQNTNLARGGNIVDFMNNLPMLQRQLSNEDIAAGGDVLRFGTGSQTQLPGSALGGGLSSLAGTLGYIYRKNANNAGGGNI